MEQWELDTYRNEMWTNLLGDEYVFADRNKKKKMKKNYAMKYGIKPNECEIGEPVYCFKYITLDSCTQPAVYAAVPVQQECKKEKTMNNMIINQSDPDQNKVEYLIDRLSAVIKDKLQDARRKYGLTDDEEPRNGQEYVDRILSGKYIVENKTSSWLPPSSYIRWCDPAVKPDQTAYEKVRDALNELRTSTEDEIRIKSPADGLVALRAFESTTIN